MQSADLPSGALADADVMTLTLNDAAIFVGVNGALSGITGTEVFADVGVVNGTLGFGAQVTKLTLVSIKDRGPAVDPLDATDDITYLGVALDNFNGQLVGLEDLLVFHAYDVDALINKATHADGVTIPAKLDWSTFTNTGLNITPEVTDLNTSDYRSALDRKC